MVCSNCNCTLSRHTAVVKNKWHIPHFTAFRNDENSHALKAQGFSSLPCPLLFRLHFHYLCLRHRRRACPRLAWRSSQRTCRITLCSSRRRKWPSQFHPLSLARIMTRRVRFAGLVSDPVEKPMVSWACVPLYIVSALSQAASESWFFLNFNTSHATSLKKCRECRKILFKQVGAHQSGWKFNVLQDCNYWLRRAAYWCLRKSRIWKGIRTTRKSYGPDGKWVAWNLAEKCDGAKS